MHEMYSIFKIFSKDKRSGVECWIPERDILEVPGTIALLICGIFSLFLRIQALDPNGPSANSCCGIKLYEFGHLC